MRIYLLATFLLFQTLVSAQVIFYDDQADREYEINQNTEQRVIEAFLNEHKSTEIEFNENELSEFPFRLKNKKDNWMLYHGGRESLFMKNDAKKYSFQLPSKMMEIAGITIATHKKKSFIVNLYERQLSTKLAFDEVTPQIQTDTIHEYNPDTDEVEETYFNFIASFEVKQNNKWGLIELSDGQVYLSHNFIYDSHKDLPPPTSFSSFQLEMMENLRSEFNLDLLAALDENGFLFKGRDEKSGLWGVYGGEGRGQVYIPANYDSLKKHRDVCEVWKNNKVGYYNSDFQVAVEPLYDEFRYVHLDYKYGCALKMKGEWTLHDAFNAEKLVEGSAKSIDGLIELWLDR